MPGKPLLLQRLAAGVAALAVTAALTGHAHGASVAYAFAQQTISDLSLVPGSGTLSVTGSVVTGTTDASTQNGTGISHADPVDALQSYLGTPPPPPENDFNKYATFPGGSPIASGTAPTGLVGGATLAPFSRGDSLITGVTSTSSASVVAESYVNGTPSHESGSGALSATVTITPSASTTLAISYTFANDAYVMSSAGTNGGAQAQFHFNITIKDAAGNVVFNSTTANTNLSLGSPPNGPEVIGSGSETVTTGTLTGGNAYTVIFSQSAATFVSPPIPEPSSVVMAGSAIAIGLIGARLRRRLTAR
jgi:hypothetical protein